MVVKEGVHSYLATLDGNITTSCWNYQVIHSTVIWFKSRVFITSLMFSSWD